MSQYVETATRTFIAGGALAAHIRVKLSSGKLAAAAANEEEIGTTERAAFADGDTISVRLRTAQGTVKMTAGGPITSGAAVNGAASGKIDDDAGAGSVKIGIALEAASGDGSIIEVLRHANTGTN